MLNDYINSAKNAKKSAVDAAQAEMDALDALMDDLSALIDETETTVKDIINDIKNADNNYADLMKKLNQKIDKFQSDFAQKYNDAFQKYYDTDIGEISDTWGWTRSTFNTSMEHYDAYLDKLKNEGIKYAVQEYLASIIIVSMGGKATKDAIEKLINDPMGIYLLREYGDVSILLDDQLRIANLYGTLYDIISEQENWYQKGMRELNMNYNKIIKKLIEKDDYITRIAIELEIPKSWLQAILFREMRCLNPLDWSDYLFSGNSIGWGQIKPSTAINWYNSEILGNNLQLNSDDEHDMWDKLKDVDYNIQVVAMIIAQNISEIQQIKEEDFDLNDIDTVNTILSRYNSGSVTSDNGYGSSVFQYIDAFDEFNS